jgi:hypothetical protein
MFLVRLLVQIPLYLAGAVAALGIAGITPGRSLRAYGRITRDHGERVMFNPAYELRP